MRTETAPSTQTRNSRVDVILDLIDQALAEYDEQTAQSTAVLAHAA